MMGARMLVVGLVSAVLGVFIAVLGVVTMVKIIQIAEDLRYLRSKSDLTVERPRTTRNTVVVCLIVSAIILVLIFAFFMGLANGNSGMSALMR